jgi:hypothetical protein
MSFEKKFVEWDFEGNGASSMKKRNLFQGTQQLSTN